MSAQLRPLAQLNKQYEQVSDAYMKDSAKLQRNPSDAKLAHQVDEEEQSLLTMANRYRKVAQDTQTNAERQMYLNRARQISDHVSNTRAARSRAQTLSSSEQNASSEESVQSLQFPELDQPSLSDE